MKPETQPSPPPLPGSGLQALRDAWTAAWPGALAAWSRFTRLRPPALCLTVEDAKTEGLTGSFAMIRLVDQAIVVSLPAVAENGVGELAREVLAHEIGHHVYAPGNLTDHARMIARMRWGLPTVEQHAPMVANLYTDLLINDRLQRGADGLRMADVYRAMAFHRGGEEKPPAGAVWTLYVRIYELLWSLERGSLGGGRTDDRLEGDAALGARLVRSYAREFLDGSGRFACLLLPHLLEDKKSQSRIDLLLDTRQASAGGEPAGLAEYDADEQAGAIHPAQDPELNDLPVSEGGDAGSSQEPPSETAGPTSGQGQSREPFAYGEILRAAGLNLSDHEIAVRFYRERARPHLIPFPGLPRPRAMDLLPEGLEPWSFGDPLDAADWMQSVLQSPRPVPGLTTVQRVWGVSEDVPPKPDPLDLDLYVDSSGSMMNPQRQLSFPALAGAILCLSALRAGARVQVTLWSGTQQWTATEGFVRDENAILRVLTGYFGGGTAFPIHRLRETYAGRGKEARPTHILCISDDGVTSMFDQQKDEKGNLAWDVAVAALRAARGGGTLVLNLVEHWERLAGSKQHGIGYRVIQRARDEGGWAIYRITAWDELVRFAREFSRRRYGRSGEIEPRMKRG